jgi:hypothetical protein
LREGALHQLTRRQGGEHRHKPGILTRSAVLENDLPIGDFAGSLRTEEAIISDRIFGRLHFAFCRRSATGEAWAHPPYFDHNALYHVLRAIALFTVFLASRETRKSGEFIN